MEPIIFKKVNLKFRPNVVLAFNYEFLAKLNNKFIKDIKRINEIDFYEFFWYENEVIGAFCHFSIEDQTLSIETFDLIGKPMGKFEKKVDQDHVNEWSYLSHSERLIASQIIFALHLITISRRNKKQSIFTAQRNKASVYYREGDVLKWKRIWDMNKLPSPEYVPPEPGLSGIRKKEHDVIGHYRIYKNGAKVWVRPHKRGDPTLGVVTKLITD